MICRDGVYEVVTKTALQQRQDVFTQYFYCDCDGESAVEREGDSDSDGSQVVERSKGNRLMSGRVRENGRENEKGSEQTRSLAGADSEVGDGPTSDFGPKHEREIEAHEFDDSGCSDSKFPVFVSD